MPHEIPIENIWLMREGGESELPYVVVYVKRQGVWYRAIRELLESNFSHCISSHGIPECEPAEWLNRAERNTSNQAQAIGESFKEFKRDAFFSAHE